jgi:chitin disaccharide deacetylase
VSLKRLIVNADDLGRTAELSRGVFKAQRDGVVTSATLAVSGAAARDVSRMSAEGPQLGIGLHVALTGGASVLPPERIPTLVGTRGSLPAQPEALRGADPGEVLAEARAQLKRFREVVGKEPTHLDCRHHAHRVPVVLDALVTVSWETGLPVRSASPEIAERLRREGIKTTDRFVDGFFGGEVSEDVLVHILQDIPPGTTELMWRPVVSDEPGSAGAAGQAARELAVLTNQGLRQILQATGVRLIHFGQL